jgi:hypothetical protein|eukprot:COSAG01_NODE_274_length_19734_cov_122.033512_3_plen_137_part_00
MLRAQFHRVTEGNLVGAFGRRDAFGSARYDDTSTGYRNFTRGHFGKFENHTELTSQEFNRALERLGITNPNLRKHFFQVCSRSRDARRTGISSHDVVSSSFIEPRDVSDAPPARGGCVCSIFDGNVRRSSCLLSAC